MSQDKHRVMSEDAKIVTRAYAQLMLIQTKLSSTPACLYVHCNATDQLHTNRS